ncbi:MAG TPA: adenylate/guanylate cyclase domain-containing protein [Gaiellaceae bacterium]
MSICPQCGRENPDGFKFCGSCGAPLVAVEQREVRKTVTVVFCDVTGSTALGEQLDPESLRRVMGRYFDEMRSVVERHEGTVEKFIGDAVMAVFGIPVVHEDDAIRAVRAAAEMRDRLGALNDGFERDWGVRIQMRTGVNTGEVVAGDSTGGQRFATGDAVNVAKRFEEAAPAGEILLGEPTYGLVRDAVEVEPIEPLALKGKESRLGAYRLLSIEPTFPGRARRLDSPMVGRERERMLLQHAYERAVGERGCHLFTVLGTAGVGKSRLVAEFAAGIGETATVVEGRCLPYGEGITFWPLAEIVRKLHGKDPLASIPATLAGDENAEVIASRLAAALGLAERPGAGEETFWAARKLFEAHARKRPLVVVFDDVQWGEPTFLDFIDHVTDWTRDAPILLVCLARPELLDIRPAWSGGKFNSTSVLLESLSKDESEQLIGNLLGRAELADEVRLRVAEAAEGNPLFVEETLAMLIDDGLLERRNGGWVAAGDLTDVSVPPTIQALLAARLDRLGDHERGVIERASVEGRIFHRGAVAALSPAELRADVGGHLQNLVRKELVRPDRTDLPGEDAFRFRHLLIRDAAYESMPKELRADLHERFAGWLERAQRTIELEEILGYHLEQAYLYRAELAPVDEAAQALGKRAAELLEAAGRRAQVRGDRPAATNLLGRAWALLPPRDPRLPALLVDLGTSLLEKGELGEAERALTEAANAARELGSRGLELRAELERGYLATLIDPGDVRFGELADKAIPELERLGDEQVLAVAWRIVAHLHLYELRGAEMEGALKRSIEHARRAGDRRAEVDALLWLIRLHWFGPQPVDAGIRLCEQTLAEAETEPGLASVATQVLGVLYGLRGEFDRGRALLERAAAVQVDLGMQIARAAGTSMMRANLELLAGDFETAERVMRPSLEILQEAGERGYYSTCLGYLAAAVYGLGRYDEAEQLALEAEEAGGADDVETQRLALDVRAKVLARRGESAEAERLVRRVIELLEPTDSLTGKAEALLALAAVLELAGRHGEGASAAHEAAKLYAKKGAKAGVRLAETRAAELEAESSSP